VWISTLCWILYDAVFGSPAGIRHRSGEVLFVALFFVFGVWLIFRRHLITFDLKNGRVRIAAPGSISTERSVSGGLTLLLNQHRTEWCASVAYGPCEIARTAVLRICPVRPTLGALTAIRREFGSQRPQA
jgi:hypothetical protein